jgi:ATP-dependent DNA ligase
VTSSCAAVLVVFDLLVLDGCELLDQPLARRRQQLESLLSDLHPCLQRVDQTASIEPARDWLANLSALEGVVAKRVDGRYRPGYRGWLKVKCQRTADSSMKLRPSSWPIPKWMVMRPPTSTSSGPRNLRTGTTRSAPTP